MKAHRVGALLAFAAATLWLTACGGSSTPPPPPAVISVAFSATPATSLAAGTTTSVTAVVTNDSKNAGVTWTVTCATTPCGSFLPTSTASGAATTYTAPSTPPTPATVTITATSVTDATKTASATITITGSVAAISVALSPAPPTSLAAGATTSLTAVVTNDSKNAGVTWTVTCGTTPCGSFSPTSTASGVATTYTAPSAPPTPATVTVTATSVTDTTKTASATITITTAQSISVALSTAPPTSLVAATTTSITATVTNDSKNAGVTWTATCGSAACGSFAPTSTASGAATIYTAPNNPPVPATVTVTATSVTDTTKTASATITITPIVPASGTYVYHISGQDSTGPYFIVGAFTVQSGAITAGEQDFSDGSFAYTNNLVASGSTLTVAGSNIQIVLNTGNPNIGVSGIETLRGTRVSGTRVLLSEFDAFATGVGSLDLQTSTAAPSGGYAFNVGGVDGSSAQVPLGIGGILNITGTTVSNTMSVFDYNDGGSVGQDLLFSSGTVTVPDSFGRITITLIPSSTNVPGFTFTGYIVGTNRIQLVEAFMDPLDGDLGGTALGQGSNAGKFTLANSNATYVFTSEGADANAGVVENLEIGGSLTLNNGLITGTLAVNDLTNFGTAAIAGGTYTVDPTGRVTLVNITPSLNVLIPFAFQLYLDGNGNALELGVDNSQETVGMAYQQTAASTTPFAGTFALSGSGFGVLNNSHPAWSAAGPVSVASNAFTGFTDYNLQSGTQTSNVSLSGTETSASALLSLNGLNAAALQTPNNYTYFQIDSMRVIAIETDGQQLGLLQLEGVGP